MTDPPKKKFRQDEARILSMTNTEAYRGQYEVAIVKRVYQVVFNSEIAHQIEYNGENVSLIAQLQDWKENYDAKSPMMINIAVEDMEEFMTNFKFNGESINKSAMAEFLKPQEGEWDGKSKEPQK